LRSKEIAEGGLFSGIFAVLLILTLYTPLGLISIYLLPVPTIIFGYRNSSKGGLVVVLVNLLLGQLFAGIYGLFIGLVTGTVGLAMGVLYRRNGSIFALIGGGLVTIVNLIFVLAISNFLFKVNIVENIKEYLLQSLNTIEAIIKSADPLLADQAFTAYQDFFNTIEIIIPFMIITFSVLFTMINYSVSRMILNRLGTKIEGLPPFREWTLPKSVFYYYIITIIAMMTPLMEQAVFKTIFANLYPLLQILFIIQGLSFVFFYVFQKKKGKAWQVIASICAFIPLLSQVIHLLGIFDLGLNLRKKLEA